MPKGPVRLGLIGAGRWGRNYIRTLRAMDGVKLARLASRNPETLSLVDETCMVSENWEKVASARDIDGVIIATPPAIHAEMVETAVTFARPVLVEKPLTMDLAEAIKIRRLVEEYDGYVMVGHTHLFHPAYRALKQLAQALGPVRAIAAEAGNHGPFRDDTPVLWDWGIHDVALCLDLLGTMPIAGGADVVESRQTEDGLGQILDLKLIFPDDVSAQIRIGNMMDKRRRFTAHFETAVLVFDDLAPNMLTLHAPTQDFAAPKGPGEALDITLEMPLGVVVREFVQAIKDKDDDLVSLDLGIAAVSVLSDCERALKG